MQCNPYQNTTVIYIIRKKILNFTWNQNKNQDNQNKRKKTNQAQSITILDFKVYYKTILIKTSH